MLWLQHIALHVAVEYLLEPSGKNLGAKGLCTRWRVSSYDRNLRRIFERKTLCTGRRATRAASQLECVCLFLVEINESPMRVCPIVHHLLSSSSDWDGDASSRQVVKTRETLFRFLYLISRVGGDLDFHLILFLGRPFRSSLSLSSRLHISTYSLTVDFNHRKCGPRSHSSQR